MAIIVDVMLYLLLVRGGTGLQTTFRGIFERNHKVITILVIN